MLSMYELGRRLVAPRAHSRASWLCALLWLLSAMAPASAGQFGGFSADESTYLMAGRRICRPLAARERGAPVCKKATAEAVSAARFTSKTKTKTKTRTRTLGLAEYRANARGRKIEIRSHKGGEPVRVWEALSVISRIIAVYQSRRGGVVAVEFESRLAGRIRAEVVAFVLAEGGAKKLASLPPPGQEPAKEQKVVGRLEREGAIAKALRRARYLYRRRRYPSAGAAFARAFALNSKDPEAVYGLAASAAALGKSAQAIAKLRALSALHHPEVAIWMVAARSDKVFDKLRADEKFRLALGLDPGARRVTAYEQLFAFGARTTIWEQAGAGCGRPKVSLELRPEGQRFKLKVKGRCNGSVETTRLRGAFTTQGASRLTLVFPNSGQSEEELVCSVLPCKGEAGENCLQCALDQEAEFVLRVVRR